MSEATPIAEHPYTLRGVREMLGLSRHAIVELVELGFVSPGRGPGKAYRFSFRDVVLLRSAHELRAARIPTRQILRSLRRLKEDLPADVPVSGLRIMAAGNRIAVRAEGAEWEPDTGQLLMDLRVSGDAGSVSVLARRSSASSASSDSPDTPASPNDPEPTDFVALFATAEALEESDPPAAEQAYRHLLALSPDHAHAYLNLGYMLCEAGRCEEAVALYDRAVVQCPDDPLVHYNRAVALEDLGRVPEALKSYERSLALQPDLADAHQNAALLYERAGDKQRAIRHFSAFRRLQVHR
ncbi:MAG: tetratricopeptide repeat protein [Gammaproteobacteria bacterium]|nr:tetratricopeptide repeat protein [Gammaproteobacteria bacterium]MBU1441411.1 tetratricopeptide repeat protein [Gammaproteobacteria bacterium]